MNDNNKLITILPKQRPMNGMGARSPRYELYTHCCGMFLAADESVEKLKKNADRHGVDVSKLVIFDLGKVI